MTHSCSGLYNRLEHAIRTHGDAAFTASTFLGVFNDHMLVKPYFYFPQHIVFALVDTRPAGFAFAGVRPDMLCAVSSRSHCIYLHDIYSLPFKRFLKLNAFRHVAPTRKSKNTPPSPYDMHGYPNKKKNPDSVMHIDPVMKPLDLQRCSRHCDPGVKPGTHYNQRGDDQQNLFSRG
jgi:hypothetical protein